MHQELSYCRTKARESFSTKSSCTIVRITKGSRDCTTSLWPSTHCRPRRQYSSSWAAYLRCQGFHWLCCRRRRQGKPTGAEATTATEKRSICFIGRLTYIFRALALLLCPYKERNSGERGCRQPAAKKGKSWPKTTTSSPSSCEGGNSPVCPYRIRLLRLRR